MSGDAIAFGLEALADDAWLLRLGDRIDAATNARVHRLCARVREQAPAWLRDVVPAYASAAVFFDPAAVAADDVHAWLAALSGDEAAEAGAGAPRVVDIPLVYGGTFGPDLDAAAAELGIAADDLVQRHAAGEYRVAMIGFAPGFPYLLGLDPALSLPRLPTPRAIVPAGSVGIGGSQTGIYPRESPGGWRLIGRTPRVLFDPARGSPALLAPGDRVRFRAIEAEAFARWTDPA